MTDRITSLAVAAREGDRTALENFIRLTQADVWRFCARATDMERADDLTQETYERAWRALPRYRGDAPARLWLLGVARHVVADHVRRRARRSRLASVVADSRIDRIETPDRSDTAEAHANAALLDSIDHDQRSAFVLTQMLGLSYAEAAEVAGVPVGTIRSRVARARDALIQRIAEAESA